MENKTTQQNVKKKAIQNADGASVETKKKPFKVSFLWIAVLLLICLQAGSFWLWMQQKSLNVDLNQQLSSAMTSFSKSSKLAQLLQNADMASHKQLSSLESKQKLLAERVQELSDSQQITRGDVEQYWALSEVEYLLNMANQRVVLVKDVASAGEALEMADQRIEALSDYRLHPLRALLADEQLALSSVVKVDVDGMALQLQSALEMVDNLQVLLAPALEEDEESDTATSANWQGALDNAWQEVKSLVVIRHQQDGAAAVLVPEQRYFLYQNLKLKLEAVRLALLSSNSSLYDASLKSSTQWLEQYFVGEERDAMLTLLAELEAINIEVILPDISASLAWLKGFER